MKALSKSREAKPTTRTPQTNSGDENDKRFRLRAEGSPSPLDFYPKDWSSSSKHADHYSLPQSRCSKSMLLEVPELA